MKFIRAYFKTFKNQGKCEKHLRRENGNKFLLKMMFIGPKKF